MALQKQVIPVVLNQGLDTKTDSKLVQQGKMLVMENCHMQKNGNIQARKGYDLVTTPPDNIQFSCATQSEELLVVSQDTLYSYNDASDSWNSKGICPLVAVSKQVVWSDIQSQIYCDSAGPDLIINVWQESSAGVYYSYYDKDTKEVNIPKTLISASGTKPRVQVLGFVGYVLYFEGANLKCSRIDLRTKVVTTAAIATDAAQTALDFIPFNGSLLFAYKNTATHLSYGYITPAGVLGTSVNGYPTKVVTSTVITAVCLTENAEVLSTPTIGLSYISASTFYYYELNAALQTGIYSYGPGATTTGMNVIGHVVQDDVVHLFASDVTFGSSQYFSLTKASNTLTSQTLPLNIHLTGKPILINNKVKAPFYYKSTDGLQDTMLLVNTSGTCEAISKDVQFNTTDGRIQNFNPSIAASLKERILSENGVLFSSLSVGILLIESITPTISKRTADVTYISGGFLKQYDGTAVTESSFLLAPEQPTLVDGTTGSGALTVNGHYSYSVVWEWIDAKGRRMQSAPSVPVLHDKTSGDSITVVISPLAATLISTPISVAVYRSVKDGTILYKVTSDSSPTTMAAARTTTINFVDTLADTSITSREILYTTGNVLDNTQPGKVDAILVTKTRGFIGGLEDANQIAYSKLIRKGQALNFNETLVLPINPEGGRITAVEELDDKVIFFKERSIYYSTGEGPSDTGVGNTISLPQFITSDVGCIEPRSLVKVPSGLMFMTHKGIYLLDRSFNTSYVGAEVEDFNSLSITGSSVEQNNNQVRFSSSEGTVLVYDYYWRQWSTFVNLPSIGGFVWNKKHTLINSDKVLVEGASYSDNGATVNMRIVTSWMSIGQLAGFQRIYRVQVLGNFIYNHILKAQCYYDFRDFPQDFQTWDPTIGRASYGQGTYGELGFGGSNDGVYRVELRNSIQKCTAFKLELTTDFPDGIPTGGFELSSVSLQVGVKQGFGKMNTTKYSTST